MYYCSMFTMGWDAPEEYFFAGNLTDKTNGSKLNGIIKGLISVGKLDRKMSVDGIQLNRSLDTLKVYAIEAARKSR